jgi:hypothetical protein
MTIQLPGERTYAPDLIAGPHGDFLYAGSYEKLPDDCCNGRLLITRIDLSTGAVDEEIPLDKQQVKPTIPRLFLNPFGNKLWLYLTGISGAYWDGFRLPSETDIPTVFYSFDLTSSQVGEGKPAPWPMTVLNVVSNPVDEGVLMVSSASMLYRAVQPGALLDEAIMLGASPQDITVSETRNEVYVSRVGEGGFYILDGSGDIIRTVEGGVSRNIFADEIADRLYVYEEEGVEKVEPQLGVFELSTLRRLHTAPMHKDFGPDETGVQENRGIKRVLSDPKRGVIWVIPQKIASANALFKLDSSTGEELKAFSGWEIGGGASAIAIDSYRDRAYVGTGAWGDNNAYLKSIKIFDLETEIVVKTIALSDLSDSWNTQIVDMGVDVEKQRLYAEVQNGGGISWINSFLIVDTSQDTVVGNFSFDFRMGGEMLFDFDRGKAYKTDGGVIDLETLSGNQSYTGVYLDDFMFDFALNKITNTIYSLKKGVGLEVYLGPAGTEIPPPVAPSEVTVTAGDEEVELAWSAVDDLKLVGYFVYRQDRRGADFVRITHGPVVGTTFRDEDVTNGQIYAYRVTGIGQNALESLTPSDPVSATPTGGGNFRLLVLRKSVSAAREDSTSLPMSVESLEGFGAEVTLTAEAPEGVEVSFIPEKVTPTKVVEVRVKAAADATTGRFEIALKGEGGEVTNIAPLVVEVTEKVLEQSVLTLEPDQEEVPLDIPLQVNGRLFPTLASQVELTFTAEKADTVISLTVETDREGGYRAQFLAPFTDRWTASASWAGNDDFQAAQSRSVEFAVTSGKTRITCTSDLADDADLGWVSTVKGRIYPNSGTVGVTLNVRKPDGTEETIEGILSSSEGYYGHDLRMDQKGLWELWTSWKGNDRLLGATSPVVTVPVGTDVGRVVMVACGQDSPKDLFWSTSNYLANLAYTTFQKRRLLKEKVLYLNDRQAQDVDRDGFQEDVDGGATMAGMSDAWTWVKERVNADNPLYVYLVGKGTPLGLEVSEGEVLTAAQLGEDLAEIETATGASITLIVDAAHAGNFIRDLSSQGRKVIASTGMGLAFYQAEGYLSFSQYFLTDLYQGKSLQEAFLHTHNILRNLPGGFSDQRPGLEAEGNVIANQPGDYLQTTDAFIGAPFELGDLSPQIKASSLASVAGGVGKRVVTQTVPISEDGLGPRLKLARPVAEQGVEISARIDDAEGNLKVVRAMIIPPESNSLTSLTSYPEVELTDEDGDGMWGGVSHEFLEEGVYPVIIYAIDGAGNAAEPLRTTVLVEPPPPLPTGDFNGDGLVDFADFFMFADQFGGTDPAYDLDQSGTVDFGDFFLFADAFGGPLGKLLELAEEMLVLPTEYALRAPYPNPFNSEVVVKYSLPREGEVELAVFNALGQVVRRLVEGRQGMGHHRVVWDGRDERGRGLATGTYIVQLRAGERRSDASRPADFRFRQVQKVALIK